MMTKLSDLKSKAEAAKKEMVDCPNCNNEGSYVTQTGQGEWEQCQCEFCYSEANSVFYHEVIAVASPDVVLKLIKQIELYEEVLKSYSTLEVNGKDIIESLPDGCTTRNFKCDYGGKARASLAQGKELWDDNSNSID